MIAKIKLPTLTMFKPINKKSANSSQKVQKCTEKSVTAEPRGNSLKG